MSEHRVLFEHDPEIGRTTYLIFNDWGRIVGAHVEQNIDDIIEHNRRMSSLYEGKKFGDYKPVASLPVTLLEKTGLGDAIDAGDRKYLGKILNDSDYSGFRTGGGRV
jgi:hypothetical protein